MSGVTSRRVSAATPVTQGRGMAGRGSKGVLPHQHTCLHALPCVPERAARYPLGLGSVGVGAGSLPRPAAQRVSSRLSGTRVVQTLVRCTCLQTEVNMTSDM